MSDSEQDRIAVIADIARLLPQRNGQLGRLLWRHARGPLHRGMASVLATLGDGPETISRLAEREGVAQPTLTRMVERLEAEGLVQRERSTDDARVVVVCLTPQGELELAELRERYLAVLSDRLASLPDQRLSDLRDACDAIQVLIDALQPQAPVSSLPPQASGR
jgi:DNA-binding MarR family transcriptional regulator